ncbi:hypothetical protein GOP47_0027571 [Adiantum capillus-veneris]|nr:hypothetical protein GOP47_0027571 [Adiantum capillus-veneris]
MKQGFNRAKGTSPLHLFAPFLQSSSHNCPTFQSPLLLPCNLHASFSPFWVASIISFCLHFPVLRPRAR